ncbi:lysophospholipid acyltransferase family protein [uncultured Mailhella sp.]|uniref:lysophospholipid acyltransferase family protein n=1 Tax=uncultured Mailhella sp. TaxID=1981031 RepID=UPI00260DE210|nr:lysophospholipid acyltransferase family protein [uncultured Mailhella sp.]
MTIAESLRYRLLTVAGALLRPLGFQGTALMGTALGDAIWHFIPSRRTLAVDSIKKHLNVENDEAERIAHESFRQNGRSFLEILLTGKFGLDSPKLRIAQPELMERLCACKRPIVATTAHFGSWELLASMLGQLYAPPRPRMVVVRRYGDAAVQRFIACCREATGADMVGHRNAAAPVIRALHKNGIVAFLVDHNALAAEARFIPFLDETAAVNAGPAILALRAKALVWPVVLAREGRNYVFLQRPPLDTATLTGGIEENVHTVAQFYTQAVESFIREHPEQWFWMHERWKTRPPRQHS